MESIDRTEFFYCPAVQCERVLQEYAIETLDDLPQRILICPFCNLLISESLAKQLRRALSDQKYTREAPELLQKIVQFNSERKVIATVA